MSWQIPTQIEQDIISGKATYRTFQTGNGGQSILPVPANAYVVIFGYDFSPSGGGFKILSAIGSTGSTSGATILNSPILKWFETQQISFYTGTDFYSFIHHVDGKTSGIAPRAWNATNPDENLVGQYNVVEEIDTTPLSRQVYITSSNDVTLTVGLINNVTRASANTIPVTNRTPVGLTFGGSPQSLQTQSNYGPAITPLQFMQPSPKDYQDFGFGLLPNNADGQAFATPDAVNGLRDPSDFIVNNIATAINQASSHYYLCLHYALYQKPIPSKQG